MANESFAQNEGKTTQTLASTPVTGRKTEAVAIKGTANGLLIRLRDDNSVEFGDLLVQLKARLHNGEKFFRGARSSVDLGRRELQSTDLEGLLVVLQQYEIKLEYIVSGSNTTRNIVKQAGIEFKLPNNRNTRPPVPDFGNLETPGESSSGPGMPFDTAEALFIRRTLRSGQLIRHHSDVCILGDVNPGAEIIAGGNIIIWGSLRGAVWAGADKINEKERDSSTTVSQAVVCALHLNAMQLNIGNLVTHAPENAISSPPTGPEIAYILNGQIIVEPWLPGKKILRGAS